MRTPFDRYDMFLHTRIKRTSNSGLIPSLIRLECPQGEILQFTAPSWTEIIQIILQPPSNQARNNNK
eukprot:c3311_g1_i1 orf=12-212(-)